MRNPFKRSRAPHPSDKVPDERVWGRHYTGPAPWVLGLAVSVVLLILGYLAFVKELPWADEGYQLEATFENAATLRTTAPVRIAGVKVGEVTDIEADGDATKVTFSVSDDGRPVHSDAEVEIRPRLFLEGNFFLDLDPGSPSAPELDEDGSIPVTQTATAVQLDEVLAALQDPQRRGLQKLLEGFGTALTYEPTAADDADQASSVQGETAGESLNDSFRYGGDAGKGAAIVNTALLGEQRHDLSGLIRAQATAFSKLSSVDGELSDLITNFNTTVGALAAESENLAATIQELAPTLEETRPSLALLSSALPSLRAFAIELRPAIEELPETIDLATPWLHQTRELVRKDELGGLAPLLARSAPGLAESAAATKTLFNEQTALARCTSNVLIPTGNVVINDDFSTGQSNYREFLFSTVNIAGESQGFDGNGPYLRFYAGGGPQLVQSENPDGFPGNTKVFGNAIEAPDGIQPALPTEPPPFRMDVPCAGNELPDINGPAGAVAPADLTAAP